MSSRSYPTRFPTSLEQDLPLSGYARLSGQIIRNLHVKTEEACAAGVAVDIASFKNETLTRYGITSRQFNAIEAELSGKRQAVIEARAAHRETLTDQIQRLEKKIRESTKSLTAGRLSKDGTRRRALTPKERQSTRYYLHQKKRRLHRLTLKLAVLTADSEAGRVRLCFGSRDLFAQQYRLEEHGFESHERLRIAPVPVGLRNGPHLVRQRGH